jgi:hypothetical protein
VTAAYLTRSFNLTTVSSRQLKRIYSRAMVDDDLLAQVANAVQGALWAFRTLCRDHKGYQSSDTEPHDLLALDVSLHALGNIVEILNGLEAADVQLEFVHSILAAPVIVSSPDNQTSMANAMITDMRNLKRRLTDVRHDITNRHSAVSAPSVQILPPGEAISIRRMVEKYHSIISEVSSGQNMYVISRRQGYLCLQRKGICLIP